MVKIFIKNRTNYETQSIKDFLKPIVEHEGMTDSPTVFECYHRDCNILGQAFYRKLWDNKHSFHYYIKLNLPIPEELETKKEMTIKTVIHEYAHCRGLRHKEIRGGHCVLTDVDVSWFDFSKGLKLKMASAKEPKNLKKERFEKTLAHLKQAESKAKRWNNLVKKYKKKVKYYKDYYKLINDIEK